MRHPDKVRVASKARNDDVGPRQYAFFDSPLQAVHYALMLWDSEDEEPRGINFRKTLDPDTGEEMKPWVNAYGREELLKLVEKFSDSARRCKPTIVYDAWGEF